MRARRHDLRFDRCLIMRVVSLAFVVVLLVACKSSPLDGTDLPEDQGDCEDRGGSVIGDRCWFFVNEKRDPELFRDCVRVGGGETSDEGGGATCKIVYKGDEVCLGNACD